MYIMLQDVMFCRFSRIFLKHSQYCRIWGTFQTLLGCWCRLRITVVFPQCEEFLCSDRVSISLREAARRRFSLLQTHRISPIKSSPRSVRPCKPVNLLRVNWAQFVPLMLLSEFLMNADSSPRVNTVEFGVGPPTQRCVSLSFHLPHSDAIRSAVLH